MKKQQVYMMTACLAILISSWAYFGHRLIVAEEELKVANEKLKAAKQGIRELHKETNRLQFELDRARFKRNPYQLGRTNDPYLWEKY